LVRQVVKVLGQLRWQKKVRRKRCAKALFASHLFANSFPTRDIFWKGERPRDSSIDANRCRMVLASGSVRKFMCWVEFTKNVRVEAGRPRQNARTLHLLNKRRVRRS
jgi:hypothetical protein